MAPRLSAAARRRRLVAALALGGGLAGCGFRLRGTQTLPFETVFIEAPRSSQLAVELARAIAGGSSTKVVDDRGAAQAQVEIRTETRELDVLSVNAQGRAREYRIRLRVVFRVQDGKGRELLGPTSIVAFRDLAVTEEQTLAREYEEAQLVQDMLIDVAQQILRRLAALKP
jgi:LPS-assembly lipoprotein